MKFTYLKKEIFRILTILQLSDNNKRFSKSDKKILINLLNSKFKISADEEENINSFLAKNNDNNGLMNLLLDIPTLIESIMGGNLDLSLKLIDGDYFHENLLGIFIKGFNPDDSLKFDMLEDKLFDEYKLSDLDKIHLSLEY